MIFAGKFNASPPPRIRGESGGSTLNPSLAGGDRAFAVSIDHSVLAPNTLFVNKISSPPAYSWVIPSNSSTVPIAPTAGFQHQFIASAESASESSVEFSVRMAEQTLENIYGLDESGYGRSAAQEVMVFINKNLKKNCLVEANTLLERANVARMSSRSLIGLIRSTYRARDQLPAWRMAYKKSKAHLALVGRDPDALFIGLVDLEKINDSKECK